jgi:hypothetical protein
MEERLGLIASAVKITILLYVSIHPAVIQKSRYNKNNHN